METYCGLSQFANIGNHRMSSAGRQVLSLTNMQIGSSETEEGLRTYTKQEVEMLLRDIFKRKKFDWKGKQEWTTDYFKRLKVCLKWLQDVVDQKDGLQTALKSKEDEFNVTVSKLETNILSLNESLAKEESEKLAALECLKKEKEANTALEKELTEANRAKEQLESEKAAILQELSTLRAQNTFHAQLTKPDPFSLLHDDILLDIMSHIECTTKELIRTTSTISKRWQNLWASVPHLIFLEDDDVDPYTNIHGYISFIDNTINQCPTYPNLKLFKLDTEYNSLHNPEFKSRVHSWTRYAISRNAEEFDLQIWDRKEGRFTYDDELFFNSSCITHITLTWCLINPPNGVISWGGLKSLCIKCVTLDEDMLEKILSGSPCLETLKLNDCYGYRRINITSKSVKDFLFSGYNSFLDETDRDGDYIGCVKINAPYISSLTIEGGLALRELALLNVSSLVEADLDYSIFWREISHEEIFRGLLRSLKHVKDITFGINVSELLSCLEDSSD